MDEFFWVAALVSILCLIKINRYAEESHAKSLQLLRKHQDELRNNA